MKILVIGSGGREHALVWKIAQSKKVYKIYCAPGNPGTSELAENINLKVTDLTGLMQFAKKNKIDLTVVGPENPLIEGIADLFNKNKLTIIGPDKKASQIEGSKVFAKKLLLKYKIPTAKFKVFDNYRKASFFLTRLHLVRGATSLNSLKYPLVIKADGLCAGKGVAVCHNKGEALKFLKLLLIDKVFGKSGNKIIIEECLSGPEVSFMVATDGSNFISFLPSQDHKSVFNDDKGPYTGGMGAYAPVPFVNYKLTKTIEDKIVKPTLEAMAKEGIPYQGILYPGLIITKDGPKVLEFNCRFGDPETQPLMMLLKTDIIDVFEAIVQKRVKNLKLDWYKGSAVCVVLTSKGYPGNYEKGIEIYGLDKLNKKNNIVAFQAGTKKIDNKIFTNGGRVLGVTARGVNLKEAIKNAYKNLGNNQINFSGMHYRKDIGKKGIKTVNNYLLDTSNRKKITYSQVGDNYETKDPVLRLTQKAAAETAKELEKSGYKGLEETRGSSAFVWKQGDYLMATVLECLGTKNLVADEMRKITGKTYYDSIAQDTVATFINDLSTVGAKSLVIEAYWAIEDNTWFSDTKQMTHFITGWKNACIMAGAAWGGGETPTLKGIINPGTIDLAGSAVGIIEPSHRLITDDKLQKGDRILLLKSNGPNANGISLARKIAKKLKKGYRTKLPSGEFYGEAILKPTNIYSRLIQDLLDEVEIHYIVNITGHGLRKLMRARQNYSYILEKIFEPQEVFCFIQKHAGLSDYEMYQTYNMGMDYGIFLKSQDVEKAQKVIKRHHFESIDAGYVGEGPRRVEVTPKKIIYKSETYQIR